MVKKPLFMKINREAHETTIDTPRYCAAISNYTGRYYVLASNELDTQP